MSFAQSSIKTLGPACAWATTKCASDTISKTSWLAAGEHKKHKGKASRQHNPRNTPLQLEGSESVLLVGDYKRNAGRPDEGEPGEVLQHFTQARYSLAADRWFAAFRIQRRGVPAASANYCAAAVVVPHRQYRLGP